MMNTYAIMIMDAFDDNVVRCEEMFDCDSVEEAREKYQKTIDRYGIGEDGSYRECYAKLFSLKEIDTW